MQSAWLMVISRRQAESPSKSSEGHVEQYNDAQRMVEVAMDHVVIMIELVVSVV
jgi:hypothetical protein